MGSEEGLRDWFGKSSGTTNSGRKVRGWVQVGGKYDGKPCARQPGQKSTPKCVSSSKRRSMSDKERDSAARRKRAAIQINRINQVQQNQQMFPQIPRKMKENYFNRKKVVESHYGSSVNKIPKELDKAVALHKSQASRLRKSDVFKKDAGKSANAIPAQLDKAVAMH